MSQKQVIYKVEISCEGKILGEAQVQTNIDVFQYNDGATMRDKVTKAGYKAIADACENYKNNPIT